MYLENSGRGERRLINQLSSMESGFSIVVRSGVCFNEWDDLVCLVCVIFSPISFTHCF